MKILLAIDDSAGSKAAVGAVVSHSWPPHSTVKVFAVVEPAFLPTLEAWHIPDSFYAQVDAAALAQGEKLVHEASARLAYSPLAVITEVQPGHASEVILHESEKWQADLIVLGSHGHSDWQRFWFGSVAHDVAAHAPCAVEIVQ